MKKNLFSYVNSVAGGLPVTAGIMTCFALFFSVDVEAQTPVDSLDIKIGQMIMIGMPGAEVDTAVLREVREGKVGALIYFEKNIPKTNSFAGLKAMSWTYQREATIPLFIGIDQEGGKVNRLKEKYGFPRSVSAAMLAKSGSIDSVSFYAESTAATLAGLGINVNFAPVVDLAIEPNNPAIVKPERAYSKDPDSVVRYAAAVIKKHRKFGVITVVKHFPGHGSSKDDTHAGIADVTKTWTEKELEPYRQLIDSGYVDAVMSAHIVNMTLDKSGNPGTLSRDILDGILRKKLGYKGVVFSDDMQMHAITKHYGLEESIKRAINAGIDIMCFSNNIAGSEQRTVDRVHTIIKHFVATGEIPKERIDEAYTRVMMLKFGLNKSRADFQAENMRLENENEKLRQESKQIAERAQQTLKNAERILQDAEQKTKKKNKTK